jgi:hypothetical protein
VGTNRLNGTYRTRSIIHRHVIDKLQSREGLEAQLLIERGPIRAFINVGISREGDAEYVAHLFGALKVSDMAYVKKIKNAMAQNDRLTASTSLTRNGSKLLKRNNLYTNVNHTKDIT